MSMDFFGIPLTQLICTNHISQCSFLSVFYGPWQKTNDPVNIFLVDWIIFIGFYWLFILIRYVFIRYVLERYFILARYHSLS